MSKGVNISLSETSQATFRNWIKSLSKENNKNCQHIVKATAINIERRAKSFAPVVTSTLRGSIHPVFSEDGLSAQVEVSANYAPYVEFGTGEGFVSGGDVEDYASEFRGAGKRKVNNIARPYLFPAVRLSVKEMMYELNKLGFK